MDANQVAPALVRLFAERTPHNGAFWTVAVDGRGGSGKSTLVDRLVESIPGLAVVHGDDYFEPGQDDTVWGAFNDSRFDGEVLSALRSGERVIGRRPFDFGQSRVVELPSHRVEVGVIVDRCFAFDLDVPWDVRIWVETPREVCLHRGIRRDGPAWGDRALTAWSEVWQPTEDRYIAAIDPIGIADLVVDGQ